MCIRLLGSAWTGLNHFNFSHNVSYWILYGISGNYSQRFVHTFTIKVEPRFLNWQKSILEFLGHVWAPFFLIPFLAVCGKIVSVINPPIVLLVLPWPYALCGADILTISRQLRSPLSFPSFEYYLPSGLKEPISFLFQKADYVWRKVQ